MTSIQLRNGSQYCDGTLVSTRWVLTAKHCIGSRTADKFQVRVGSKDRTKGGTFSYVERVVTHGSQDLAMMKLKESVSGAIGYARKASVGANVRLLGWGSRCDGICSNRYPVILQQLDSNIVDSKSCSHFAIDDRYEFCVKRQGNDGGACDADSGGPALENPDAKYWRIDGLLSRGSFPCKPGPDVYVRISPFIDWIRAQLST